MVTFQGHPTSWYGWIQTQIPPWFQGFHKQHQWFQTPRREIALLHHSSGWLPSGQIYEGWNGPSLCSNSQKKTQVKKVRTKQRKRLKSCIHFDGKLHCTSAHLHCTAQHCTAHCTALPCTVHCTGHCTAPHRSGPKRRDLALPSQQDSLVFASCLHACGSQVPKGSKILASIKSLGFYSIPFLESLGIPMDP